MATKYLRLRALATLVAFGSLLPIACDGDDEGNPTPGTGGSGAKGGSGGKGGSGAKGGSSGSSGQAGDNGTGGSTGGSGAKGGTGAGGTGAKGGTGGKGGSGAKGGTGGTGNVGGDEVGGNGGETPNPGTECTDLVESNDYPAPCYDDCTPAKTDDSEQFLNRCSDGSQTLGGVKSDCTPWIGTLNALGDGCTKLGDGCVLPDLP